jgi:hypothetical protein
MGERRLRRQVTSSTSHRSLFVRDAIIVGVMAFALLILMGWYTRNLTAGEFLAIMWIWTLHSIVATVISTPVIYFGRRRAHWNLLDLQALLLPFAVWLLLSGIDSTGKSIANLIEPVFVSLAIPVGALVRVGVGAGDCRSSPPLCFQSTG